MDLLKIDRSKAAKQMGISRVHLTNVLNKRSKPGIVFIRAVTNWSRGAVTFHDFLE
jgi:predicted DNA-binding protein (UPF0251 family)